MVIGPLLIGVAVTGDRVIGDFVITGFTGDFVTTEPTCVLGIALVIGGLGRVNAGEGTRPVTVGPPNWPAGRLPTVGLLVGTFGKDFVAIGLRAIGLFVTGLFVTGLFANEAELGPRWAENFWDDERLADDLPAYEALLPPKRPEGPLA